MVVELLAPGGSIDSIKAAIIAGADAVYCGLDKFNARNRAENIVFAELNGLLHLAHRHDCQLFLTLNIILVDSEISALIRLLNRVVNTSLDGVIVQDLGLFHLLATYFPTLAVHASTQLTTHNRGQICFVKALGAKRVNLCRELSLVEIRELVAVCHDNSMATEVFVHGSLCLGFSGLCYLSSVQTGNSGNRGRCSQPCRDRYSTTAAGHDFPLNLKDNSVYGDLDDLIHAGVDSLKIEGRIKKFHYVHTVVRGFKKQIRAVYSGQEIAPESPSLYTVFNRDFSNGFLRGKIGRSMFIDNPRDHSALHRAEAMSGSLELAKGELYDLKTKMINGISAKIDQIDAGQIPVDLKVSGAEGTPLTVEVKTSDSVFWVSSKSSLVAQKKTGGGQLKPRLFLEKFKAINDTEYMLAGLECTDLAKGLFLPFKELTGLKEKIVFTLCGGRKPVAGVTLPILDRADGQDVSALLSVLISSLTDVERGLDVSGEVYVELPSHLPDSGAEYLDIFRAHKSCIPWFPPVLIGQEFRDAVAFLERVGARCIVTNNSGIAYVATELGIPWLAGPQMNTANSWALKCLQERLSCGGAFISTELSRQQLKKLRRPEGFALHTCLYQPILLMTSRQCLLQSVAGCEKSMVATTCIGECARSATIERSQKGALLVRKRVGHHHALYHHVHCLNLDVVTDLPDLFSGFYVDLRAIPTETEVGVKRPRLLELFMQYLQGNAEAMAELQGLVNPTTNRQYQRGI